MLYSEAKTAIKEIGKEELRILIDNLGEEVVEAGIKAGLSLSDLEEAYNGKWSSDEEFTQDLIESCGDLPKDIPHYIHIDWEATARDIMMDYTEQDGYYFRNL
jgi:antirestriction protein